MRRRSILKSLLAACGAVIAARLGGLLPAARAEYPLDAFNAETYDRALELLFSGGDLREDAGMEIGAAELAENGAVVPVKVTVPDPRPGAITLLVDKNPVPLVARFELAPNVRGFIATRIKMAESSNVVAVADRAGQLSAARRFVKVTIGGCG